MLKKNLKQNKIIAILCLISLCGTLTVGCGVSGSIAEVDVTKEIVKGETSSLGIDLSGNKSKLTDTEFYVLHDGKYYPAFSYFQNYKPDDKMTEAVADNKQNYYTINEEYNIPTLYLEAGDKLIYYDTSTMLDYIVFERYEDLGYSVGLVGIDESTSGKQYIQYSDDKDDKPVIVDGSGTEKILEDISNVNTFYLDKIGNTTIGSGNVSNGIISGATRGLAYSLDIYAGTQYHHYNFDANVHVFKAFEQFASSKIKTLREYQYEIEIPKYLVDGYYQLYNIGVNGTTYTGMIRIITKGDSFDLTDKARFNIPLLSVYTASDLIKIANGEKVDKDKGTYSTETKLNKYKTEVVGTLGYKVETTDSVSTSAKQSKLSTASIRKFNIKFPKDKTCTIELIPKKTEPAGNIQLYIGSQKTLLKYDAIMNSYKYSFTGDDNIYSLLISGIWGSFDLKLTNCEIDDIGKSSSVISTMSTDTTTTTTSATVAETKATTSSTTVTETTTNKQ